MPPAQAAGCPRTCASTAHRLRPTARRTGARDRPSGPTVPPRRAPARGPMAGPRGGTASPRPPRPGASARWSRPVPHAPASPPCAAVRTGWMAAAPIIVASRTISSMAAPLSTRLDERERHPALRRGLHRLENSERHVRVARPGDASAATRAPRPSNTETTAPGPRRRTRVRCRDSSAGRRASEAAGSRSGARNRGRTRAGFVVIRAILPRNHPHPKPGAGPRGIHQCSSKARPSASTGSSPPSGAAASAACTSRRTPGSTRRSRSRCRTARTWTSASCCTSPASSPASIIPTSSPSRPRRSRTTRSSS